jgi:hypothetical protein
MAVRMGDVNRPAAARASFWLIVAALLVAETLAFAPLLRPADDALASSQGEAESAPPRERRELHVAPTGSSRNDGSPEHPLDLATALSKKSPARPGDTIWLHGGTYAGAFVSHLAGRPGAPITVRQAPGERAVIDSAGSRLDALLVYGRWAWYWGFEITNSHPLRESQEMGSWPNDLLRGAGVIARGPNVKFINLVVHDLAGGFGIWEEAVDTEAYGNVIYYNGWVAPDRGHGHGIYTQNAAPSTRLIRDNIIFDQFSHGIHAFGSERAALDNIELEGNIAFNNGALVGDFARDILLGGGRVAANPVIRNNFTYGGAQSNLGYSAGCSNGLVTDNFFGMGPFVLTNCRALVEHNTFWGTVPHAVREQYPENVFLDEAPAGTMVRLRTNRYEEGRSHIVVYNPDHRPTVSVNIAATCSSAADRFEVRDAQNFFAPPVASGACEDSPLDLPLTGLSVAPPIGQVPVAPQHTAPDFAVFIVLTAPAR